jgi:hypothetical protein
MILFIPIVAGFHHHSVVPSGPDTPGLVDPAAADHHSTAYTPCDLCARLAVPAVMNTALIVTHLSISPETPYTDNGFRHSSRLFSPLSGRAPPSLTV